jgi:hypothetical protein
MVQEGALRSYTKFIEGSWIWTTTVKMVHTLTGCGLVPIGLSGHADVQAGKSESE